MALLAQLDPEFQMAETPTPAAIAATIAADAAIAVVDAVRGRSRLTRVTATMVTMTESLLLTPFVAARASRALRRALETSSTAHALGLTGLLCKKAKIRIYVIIYTCLSQYSYYLFFYI